MPQLNTTYPSHSQNELVLLYESFTILSSIFCVLFRIFDVVSKQVVFFPIPISAQTKIVFQLETTGVLDAINCCFGLDSLGHAGEKTVFLLHLRNS